LVIQVMPLLLVVFSFSFWFEIFVWFGRGVSERKRGCGSGESGGAGGQRRGARKEKNSLLVGEDAAHERGAVVAAESDEHDAVGSFEERQRQREM
jgi:hypothetical protein